MNTKIPVLYTTILYICAFVLFLEWLYPINVVGDVNNITVFILYTLFCFFISILQLHWLLSMSLKTVGLFFIIDSLFLIGTPLSKPWATQLFTEIGFNISALFSQQWYELTPMFRSILFLVLIWLMSYLLQYWFIVMKRIFLFVLLTFIYLTVLDTFTIYDADAAIVRTFVVSFIALGMTSLFKEIDREAIRFPWMKKQTVWIVPLVVVVMFSTLVGFAAPKLDPQWPDPVPFLKSTAENAGGSGEGSSMIQKVGYGNDDSRLGGSFVQDYSPVFRAVGEEKHYWRVETKDVYTGKGWIKSRQSSYTVQNPNNIALETYANSVETEKLQTELNFESKSSMEKLIYPYGIEEVSAEKDHVMFLLDERSGEIRTENDDDKGISLRNYSILYEKPTFSISKLRKASMEDPSYVDDRYTQLPNSLPDRVETLARKITSSEDNRYDKAQAIESYFNSNGFVYQTSNVPVPGEGEDYVAQFLFESKAGYCDNYSTTMAVMLRTLDIPARWVKGFTGGEQIGNKESGKNVYEVTSANAHSWVEVYFPETGWVPFEPTQGFSNLTDFQLNLDNDSAPGSTGGSEDSGNGQQEQKQPEQAGPQKPQIDEGTSAGKETAESNVNWWIVVLVIAVLLLVAYIIYRTRLRWQTLYVTLKYNNKSDAKTYQDAYHLLLKVLAHNGLSKNPNQTLREYSQRIDSRFQTDAMNRLTSYYERVLYKNETSNQEAAELNQLWKYLIKRAKA